MNSGAHLLSKLSSAVSVAGNQSKCFPISDVGDTRLNFARIKCIEISSSHVSNCSIRDHMSYGRCRDGSCFRDFPHRALSSSSSPHSSFTASCELSHSNGAPQDSYSESDSDSDHEPDPDPDSDPPPSGSTSTNQQTEVFSSLLGVPSDSLEPESWLLVAGEDVPTVVSSLPLMERYAPRRLLEFVAKKLDTKMFSPEQLKSALMFWKKKQQLQEEDTSFGVSAFGEKGVSQIYQWTATELTLQHTRLSRIARDILYLVLACSLLGIVRVLEALFATFSSKPPHFSKLLDAANSLDFFTMAFLAYSVRKPVIGILRVDPTNLDEVVHLKAKIWDEMHKFYERQWKVVATLAVGRLLALIAQKLPSTNAMTRNMKMCWDFLLALPIF